MNPSTVNVDSIKLHLADPGIAIDEVPGQEWGSLTVGQILGPVHTPGCVGSNSCALVLSVIDCPVNSITKIFTASVHMTLQEHYEKLK